MGVVVAGAAALRRSLVSVALMVVFEVVLVRPIRRDIRVGLEVDLVVWRIGQTLLLRGRYLMGLVSR